MASGGATARCETCPQQDDRKRCAEACDELRQRVGSDGEGCADAQFAGVDVGKLAHLPFECFGVTEEQLGARREKSAGIRQDGPASDKVDQFDSKVFLERLHVLGKRPAG